MYKYIWLVNTLEFFQYYDVGMQAKYSLQFEYKYLWLPRRMRV